MSFKDFKKNRSKVRERIEKAVTKEGKKGAGGDNDSRFWYPKADEKGAANTQIRFLPPADGSNLPWAKRFRHGFQGPTGQWYIENCPTTIGKDCPVCSANKDLWNTGQESNQNIARDRKRKPEYFYNIYVLNDKTQDDVEGTNKILKSGAYIFGMIQDAKKPEFDDEQPVDAFDLWEGADFNFKFYKKGKQLTYERSGFNEPSELFEGNEAKQEEVYNGMHSLKEFEDESIFKSYDELEKRFLQVTGASAKQSKAMKAEDMQSGKTEDEPSIPAGPKKSQKVEDEDAPFDADDADDDPIAKFKKLAESQNG